jgi:hypothetical protein
MQFMLLEMKTGHNEEGIELMIDNKSTINVVKNLIAHGRRKHIETKFHFLRDQLNKGEITLTYRKTDDQATNALTKPLKI